MSFVAKSFSKLLTRREIKFEQPGKMVNNTYEARLERLKEELNRPTVTEFLERQKLLVDATEQPLKAALNRPDDEKRYSASHSSEIYGNFLISA